MLQTKADDQFVKTDDQFVESLGIPIVMIEELLQNDYQLVRRLLYFLLFLSIATWLLDNYIKSTRGDLDRHWFFDERGEVHYILVKNHGLRIIRLLCPIGIALLFCLLLGIYHVENYKLGGLIQTYAALVEERMPPITSEFIVSINEEVKVACQSPIKSIHLWQYDDTMQLYHLYPEFLTRKGDWVIPVNTHRSIDQTNFHLVKCLLERFRSLDFAREVMSLFCGAPGYIKLLHFIEVNRHRYQ